MVHNARKDQGSSDIKGCSPDSPLQGMGFPEHIIEETHIYS